MYQKIVGTIPGQGTYPGFRFSPWLGHIWEAANRCFSHTLMFLLFFLKLINTYPWGVLNIYTYMYKYIYIFRGVFQYFVFRDRVVRERERNINVWLSCAPPNGDLAHNPGVCPDWELNWQPFGSQASTQSTEPHQPGQSIFIF
ncbi:hypothetical protein HJG60_009802 [Phyllostomus discolor]|uniref:Uncharacterized protein n=1 Tax=Phyllostomus discolor TaxID=89673 RepID=A0A834B3D1_9CHIR|nr:hypothetical protein HJG60_009802 [Phyllostomus discolor]